MNTTIDTITTQKKKQPIYYDKINDEQTKWNLLDFECIKLTHRINRFNNEGLYQIEFYTKATDDKYVLSYNTNEPQVEFAKIKDLLSSQNSTYNFLHNILTEQEYNQFEKFFNQFKSELEYGIPGFVDMGSGEHWIIYDEMYETLEQAQDSEPNNDRKAFMELVDKVWNECETGDIDRLFFQTS